MSADHLADRPRARGRSGPSSSRRRSACGGCGPCRGGRSPAPARARCSARSAAIALALATIASCQRPRRTSMCDGMWTRCPSPGSRSRSASAARVGPPGLRRGLDRVDVEVVARAGASGRARARRRASRPAPRSRAAACRRAATGPTAAGPSSPRRRARRRRRPSGRPPRPRASRWRRPARAACGPRAAARRSARRAPRSAPSRPGSLPRPAACALRERLPGGLRAVGRARTGLLMCGPFASATPQCAIAQLGSSSAARRNERIASSWLKAYMKARPWSK